jgi:hypothetical protein
VERHIRLIIVIAGLDPAIQRLLDARLKAGHDIVNLLSAPVH